MELNQKTKILNLYKYVGFSLLLVIGVSSLFLPMAGLTALGPIGLLWGYYYRQSTPILTIDGSELAYDAAPARSTKYIPLDFLESYELEEPGGYFRTAKLKLTLDDGQSHSLDLSMSELDPDVREQLRAKLDTFTS